MYKYHFKIKKNETELEFSTDDIEEFDKKVLNWVNGICQPKTIEDNGSALQRMDFIDIKNLVKLNEMAPESTSKDEVRFDDILENSINNSNMETQNIDVSRSELYNLFESKNFKNSQDDLIVTAFYMMHHENIMQFSLKQINSRLIPLKKEPATHKTVEDAVNAGFLEVVPDLTGMGTITEYTLTQSGEDYYYNNL